MLQVNGITLLHTTKYKRLPFFKKADDQTFIPKYLLDSDFDNTKTKVKLQKEYCKFMTLYYPKLKNSIEFIENTPLDEISTALFKDKLEYNTFGKLLSSHLHKFCPELEHKYTFLDMYYIIKRTGHYFYVNNKLVLVPVDYLEMTSQQLVDKYKNINNKNISETTFLKYIKDIHKDTFEYKRITITYPSSIEILPLLNYAIMITNFNNEISTVLMKPVTTSKNYYKLKVLKTWTTTIKTAPKFKTPALWHFNQEGLITPHGTLIREGTLKINKKEITVNNTKMKLPLQSPIDKLIIEFG